MQRNRIIIMAALALSMTPHIAQADPILPVISERAAAGKKLNSLIGRTFTMRGGNAFGSGLISVGYLPHSRTTVAAYFMNLTADYGKGVIVPDVVMEDAANEATQKTGEGLDVVYVNCKTTTYSYLPFPMFNDLSNVDRSWFLEGTANKWTTTADTSLDNAKWSVALSDEGGKDIARFFKDLCDATY